MCNPETKNGMTANGISSGRVKTSPLTLYQRVSTALAALQWVLCFLLLGVCFCCLMLYLLFTPLYWIPLTYSVWYVYDWGQQQRGGRASDWVRRWRLWELYRDYFQLRLIRTCALDPHNNYVFGLHPHGVMCNGHFGNFATEATGFSRLFPGIQSYLTTINFQFIFPVNREYTMATGCVSCTAQSMNYILDKHTSGGAAIGVVVGGAYESLEARPGRLILNLLRRKGFIRLALQHGASVVPVYSFGENDIFEQYLSSLGSRLREFQHALLKKLHFTWPMFRGRGWPLPLLPFRRPITTVVGKPIAVDRVENPSVEQVTELHNQYMDALMELFEANKLQYGHSQDDHLSFM